MATTRCSCAPTHPILTARCLDEDSDVGRIFSLRKVVHWCDPEFSHGLVNVLEPLSSLGFLRGSDDTFNHIGGVKEAAIPSWGLEGISTARPGALRNVHVETSMLFAEPQERRNIDALAISRFVVDIDDDCSRNVLR
tara:strand:+ start:15238 stop:15648 length:411 start_codon:yes stop_codon:yes gene_type:complete